MVLSNGTASPVFRASNYDEAGLQSFGVHDYSTVKAIKGTILAQGSFTIHKISFRMRDGSELKVEKFTRDPYGPEVVLADDEQIIGIFGTTDPDYIYQLGFIVWKPPRI